MPTERLQPTINSIAHLKEEHNKWQQNNIFRRVLHTHDTSNVVVVALLEMKRASNGMNFIR